MGACGGCSRLINGSEWGMDWVLRPGIGVGLGREPGRWIGPGWRRSRPNRRFGLIWSGRPWKRKLCLGCILQKEMEKIGLGTVVQIIRRLGRMESRLEKGNFSSLNVT